MNKVTVEQKLSLFADYWNPRVVGELNGQLDITSYPSPYDNSSSGEALLSLNEITKDWNS
jgi:hypothetical protein